MPHYKADKCDDPDTLNRKIFLASVAFERSWVQSLRV